jgi:hypothetical protein
MTNAIHVWISQNSLHPLLELIGRLPLANMDRSNDPIKLLKDRIWQAKRPIGHDLHFCSTQHNEAGSLFAQRQIYLCYLGGLPH